MRWSRPGACGHRRPLRGQDLRIAGLENTVSDALVRIAFLDGRSWTQRLTPAAPQATIPAAQTRADVAADLSRRSASSTSCSAIDHLLFVLGLHPDHREHCGSS